MDSGGRFLDHLRQFVPGSFAGSDVSRGVVGYPESSGTSSGSQGDCTTGVGSTIHESEYGSCQDLAGFVGTSSQHVGLSQGLSNAYAASSDPSSEFLQPSIKSSVVGDSLNGGVKGVVSPLGLSGLSS